MRAKTVRVMRAETFLRGDSSRRRHKKFSEQQDPRTIAAMRSKG